MRLQRAARVGRLSRSNRIASSGGLPGEFEVPADGVYHELIVPSGITVMTIDAYGAQGGNKDANPGGLGGRVKCDLTVVPGETLRMYVGKQGQINSGSSARLGGFPDGGNTLGGGGGGGSTQVRRSPYGLADRLVIAGAGGGCGSTGTPGAGGTPNGTAAVNSGTDAGGGTASAGGTSGGGTGTTAGSLGQGGSGGAFCGGGGGGRYGGGGGHVAWSAGGGGGSGLSTGVNETLETGVNSGDGSLTATW